MLAVVVTRSPFLLGVSLAACLFTGALAQQPRPRPAQPAPSAPARPAAPVVFLIQVDVAATVTVDGDAVGRVVPDQILRVPVALGEHIVRATSVEFPQVRVDRDVAAKTAGQVIVRLDLESQVVAARAARAEAAKASVSQPRPNPPAASASQPTPSAPAASAPPVEATSIRPAPVRAAPGASADTTIRPRKFDYTMETLPNGLQVVMLEDHSTPIVHLAVWYHVGSKDEKPGRTGFAHLFEHLMFKGSRNVRADQHPSWITSIGGEANAETDEDATIYWQTFPAHHLPLAVWLEADRMASLDVSEDKFKMEREVVKEERRMRFENQPFGRLPEIIFDQAFTTHPYKHQTIGSMADLEAASIADVRDFHRTYYVPNNATVVIVGDFATSEALPLVTRYLGRVPRGKPVPRDIPKEPAPTAEKRVTVTEAWPLPAVVLSHHITYDGHPDAYPLHILGKILSDGDSSRLYRSLVYEKQIALATFGQTNLIEHPNLFYAVAIVQNGHTPAEAMTALQAEIERVKNQGVTADELTRAKRQFMRDYILSRETVRQKALHLGHAAVIHNDITTADGEFDLFQNVTLEDVQRVARTYFTPESRMLLTVLPRGAAR